MARPVDVAELHARLVRWAVCNYDSNASIDALHQLPGQPASFGFDVVCSGEVVDALAMRLAGSTDDLLDQVPLLEAMWWAQVPVPEVRFWDDDVRWFGAPFIMVERFAGTTVDVRRADADAGHEVLEQAIDALALIHRADWRKRLADWRTPRTLDDEIRSWRALVECSVEPEHVELGQTTADRLVATMPADAQVGVVHGDFRVGNLLFAEDRLVAVLGWDHASIGAQLVDLGWLMMSLDATHRADSSAFDDLVVRYTEAAQRPVSRQEITWFRAAAGMRGAALASADPTASEAVVASIPLLLDHARALLD